METRTTFAAVVALALSGLAASAQTRDWLGPVTDKKPTVTADVLKFEDTSINYGPRARVRILRPEGEYEIDNSGGTTPQPEKRQR